MALSDAVDEHSRARRWRTAAYACIGLYALACVAAGVWTRFHVGLNDFWGNLTLAQQIDLRSPASLYNAFYPFGYALLLRTVAGAPVVPASLLNIACGAALLIAAWRLGGRVTTARGSIVACGIVAAWPQVFRYVTTPGPDICVATIAAFGFLWLYRPDDRSGRSRDALIGGALLGMGALLRYHGLVLGGVTILATAIDRTDWRRHVTRGLIGLLGVYALQMIVTMLAGHSPMHTGQALVFYKLVHGVNWFHVNDATAPDSVGAVINASPSAFVAAYWRMLAPMWWLPVPSLALLAVPGRARRFGWTSLATLVPYLIVVASGGSSRGTLPVLFLVAVAIGTVVDIAAHRLSAMARLPSLSVAVVLVALAFKPGAQWLREDYGTLKHRREADDAYRRIEQALRTDGVTASTQVFATDFDLYFPTMHGHTPRTNGTWLRVDGRVYNERFPELCSETITCLVTDAHAAGISHVVLTPASADLSSAAGALYRTEQSPAVELLAAEGEFKIFRIR